MAIAQEFRLTIPSGLTLPSGVGYDNWKDGSSLRLQPNFEFNLQTTGVYNSARKKTISFEDPSIGFNGIVIVDKIYRFAIWNFAVPIADATYREMLNLVINWQDSDEDESNVRLVQLTTINPSSSMEGILNFIEGSHDMQFFQPNYYGPGQDGYIIRKGIILTFTQIE